MEEALKTLTGVKDTAYFIVEWEGKEYIVRVENVEEEKTVELFGCTLDKSQNLMGSLAGNKLRLVHRRPGLGMHQEQPHLVEGGCAVKRQSSEEEYVRIRQG